MEELRECVDKFGEIGDVYMDGKETSGSEIQVSTPSQANLSDVAALCVGDGMQPSSVLHEIMCSVAYRSVGVQCETAELKTAGAQTDENDDAGVKFGWTSPWRPSTEMPDEQAAQGTLGLTTVALGAERRELDEARTDPHAGASPWKLSTEMLDEQAARGILALTTVATGAERREFAEARTNPSEGGSSGSEQETQAGPTMLTHHVDSSLEAQRQRPAVEHEHGGDDDATVPTLQVESSFQVQCQCPVDDAPLELGQEELDEDSECDESYSMELDIVFDTIGELAGEDGSDWVPVRQLQQVIQERTTMSLERLEDLLENWESMGVTYRNDTRSAVALCTRAAEAFKDEYS